MTWHSTTPMAAKELPAGIYAVDFSNPSTDHVVHKKITLSAGQQLYLDVDMSKD